MAHQKTKTAFVPNEEIRQELANAIESRKWDEMAAFQRDSNKLLNATLDMDGASVAMQIEKIHNEYASVIQYHNENSLSSVLSIAYLGAMHTQCRGLAQVTNWVKLKFVAMNLKKLATWKWRDLLSSFRFAVFSLIYVRDPVCS